MKKKIFVILIFMLILIPSSIRAVTIKSTKISGTTSISTEKYFNLTFDINFSDLDKQSIDGEGIYVIAYELLFDDGILIPASVNSREWISKIETTDNRYFVASVVNSEESFSNKCMDGYLHCSDYSVNIKFYLTNTDKKEISVGMGDIEVGLYSIADDEINFEKLNILDKQNNTQYKLAVTKSTDSTEKTPQSTIEKVDKVINVDSNVSKESTMPSRKSNNNYINSLKIENHEIEFLKSKNEYTISLLEDENKLKLDIVLSDNKAKYKVIGADDLKANDYKVQIEVTAENGDKNIYIIKAEKKNDNPLVENKKDSEEKEEVISEPKKEKANIKIDKKLIIIGLCFIGIIFVVVIVRLIISYINGKKIDKQLDQL